MARMIGPIFMKFGQTLSTRRDLLPRDIADELEKLQDRVPPFASSVARQIAEAAFERLGNELAVRRAQGGRLAGYRAGQL